MSDQVNRLFNNPVVMGIAIVACIIIIVVILRSRSENYSDQTSYDDDIKETFGDNQTYASISQSGYMPTKDDRSFNNDQKSNQDIIEHFPSAEMNVMYSDVNGNLATTTDLGLKNLTTSGDSLIKGALTVDGTITGRSRTQLQGVVIGDANLGGPDGQTWLTKEGILFGGTNGSNNGREVNSAQISAGRHEADSLCIVGMSDANRQNRKVTLWAEGGLKLYGNVYTNSGFTADGLVTSNAGYRAHNNRAVNPNHLAGNRVQFGFGSMANNESAPFADYIHFNGWGDVSGQSPNLVMFNKASIGMRIYQGGFGADAPYTGYMDAVMADSNGIAYVQDMSVNRRIYFRNQGHSDDSDPYYMEKVGSRNNNHLRLTINDDDNESFQIWGGSCRTHSCDGNGGAMRHYFGALGDASHTGSLYTAGELKSETNLTIGPNRKFVFSPGTDNWVRLVDANGSHGEQGFASKRLWAEHFHGNPVFHDSGITVNGFVNTGGNVNSGGKIQEGGNALVPRGVVVMWHGTADSVPAGWALCDGQNNTPDLRDRFVVGAGSNAKGGSYRHTNTGGVNAVTLSVAQIPSHSHRQVTTANCGAGSGGIRATFTGECANLGAYDMGVNTWNAGGGDSHENRPPFYALSFIMKL